MHDLERILWDMGLTRYDKRELIATLGALQTFPENQCRLLRLEEATRLACSVSDSGNRKVEPDELREILSRIFTADDAFALHQDPPEGCFTQNIVFHGGNYVTYSGINRAAPFILQNVLKAIYAFRDSYPSEFLSEITCCTRAVLGVSDEIAKRLGHERFMGILDHSPENIKVPEMALIKKATAAVTFHFHEIFRFVNPWPIVPKFLQPFLLDVTNLDKFGSTPEKNPLRSSPLVAVEDYIVVAAPGEMASSLLHFIFCRAQTYNALNCLVQGYRRTVADYIHIFMRPSALKTLSSELPTPADKLPFDEFLFQLDTDKAAYVQLITDDLTGFSESDPYTRWRY